MCSLTGAACQIGRSRYFESSALIGLINGKFQLAICSGIRAKFEDSVDFVTVYIEEAHPAEREHFTGNNKIATHKSFKV